MQGLFPVPRAALVAPVVAGAVGDGGIQTIERSALALGLHGCNQAEAAELHGAVVRSGVIVVALEDL